MLKYLDLGIYLQVDGTWSVVPCQCQVSATTNLEQTWEFQSAAASIKECWCEIKETIKNWLQLAMMMISYLVQRGEKGMKECSFPCAIMYRVEIWLSRENFKKDLMECMFFSWFMEMNKWIKKINTSNLYHGTIIDFSVM